MQEKPKWKKHLHTSVALALTGLLVLSLPLSVHGLTGFGLFPEIVIYPRHAGKPDPRWEDFNWRYVDRQAGPASYRLYFYDSADWVARLVSPMVSQQVEELVEVFGHTPSRRFDYVLFSSRSEFRQANIFSVAEGVLGITSTQDVSMALPYTGDVDFFRRVSKHELVHQLQVQKARDRVGDGYPQLLELIPLWFIEGMAEYYSLDGLDAEASYFMRDLLLHARPKDRYVLPELLETGPLSYASVYKAGQAKIHFFETQFGSGTAQRIFDALLAPTGSIDPNNYFRNVVSRILETSPERLEELWQSYVQKTFAESAARLPQTFEAYAEIPGVGENLDLFAVAPAGDVIAIREIDPLTGRTFIRVVDPATGRRTEAARDARSNLTSLFFMQMPTLALSDNRIVYVVQTVAGPEIEFRALQRTERGLQLGSAQRLALDGLLQASSPTLRNDGQLAFVGVSADGWPNVYTANLSESAPRVQRLTNDPYLDEDLSWADSSKEGAPPLLLMASNRTPTAKKNLFSLRTDSGEIRQLTVSETDQVAPSSAPGGGLVFQSWQSGTSQIHSIQNPGTPSAVERRRTGAKTWLGRPHLIGEQLYALGFKGGRYRLYQIPMESRLDQAIDQKPALPAIAPPWIPELSEWPAESVQNYRPFVTSGIRLDHLGGFISTGGLSGISAVASDLMRNYQVSAQFTSPDDLENTNANLLFASRRGRATWLLGGYRVVQPRIDTTFANIDQRRRLYVRSETGGLATLQYPLGAFSYIDVGARFGEVGRRDFSDPSFTNEWRQRFPEREWLISPVARLGYDSLLYETFTGPISGLSFLLESQTQYFPDRGAVNEQMRLDATSYWQIYGRTVLALEGLVAASLGDVREPFLLSGEDILRAYVFGDPRLLGTHIAAVKAELRFPLGTWFGFPPLRGLVHSDYGTVVQDPDVWREGVASSYGAGVSLNLPPVSLNFVWAWPSQTAIGDPTDDPVLHFTLRYLYF